MEWGGEKGQAGWMVELKRIGKASAPCREPKTQGKAQ